VYLYALLTSSLQQVRSIGITAFPIFSYNAATVETFTPTSVLCERAQILLVEGMCSLPAILCCPVLQLMSVASQQFNVSYVASSSPDLAADVAARVKPAR
jgi:hypothetical protein